MLLYVHKSIWLFFFLLSNVILHFISILTLFAGCPHCFPSHTLLFLVLYSVVVPSVKIYLHSFLAVSSSDRLRLKTMLSKLMFIFLFAIAFKISQVMPHDSCCFCIYILRAPDLQVHHKKDIFHPFSCPILFKNSLFLVLCALAAILFQFLSCCLS